MKKLIIGAMLPILLLVIVLGLSSCSKSSKELFEKAEKYYRSGKYIEAILTYHKVITGKNDKLKREAYYKIALIHYVNLKNSSKGLNIFELYLRKYPDGEKADEILKLLGDIYYKNFKDYHKAIAEYQKLIDNYSKSKFKVEAMLHLGKNYFLLNDFSQAIIEYRKLIREFPNDPIRAQAELEIAACYNLLGKQKTAIKLYEKIIKTYALDPNIVIMAKYFLASIYSETEQLSKALKIYRTIQYTYPNPGIIKMKIDRIVYRRGVQGRD
jgi:tetratricopeptide (TPR) repeat protein